MTVPADTATDELLERMRAHVGSTGSPQLARHPVNEPAIADWCDAIGDTNPCYTDPEYAAASVHKGIVAPPATLDIWDRPGLPATRPPDDPRGAVLTLLDAAGFSSVVAVNSELEIARYLRPGERLQNVQILEDVSERKQTGLGLGYFVTSRHRYTNADGDHVGDLRFRILKFQPGTGRSAPAPDPKVRVIDRDPARRPRPAINRDNQFLFDGYRRHELRIQRCESCGALSFPPIPRCNACGSFSMGHVVASGRGTLYSFALPHYPQVDGFRYPVQVGLVELAEGTRMVADIVGCPREQLRVGMPLEVEWVDSHPAQVDGADDSRGPISLPRFRPATPVRAERTRSVGDVEAGEELGIWTVPVTPTLIVSAALATRDFTEVHHDRDIAIRRGSKDLFMNINTSQGLMQRFVTDWAGPQALVRAQRVRLGASSYPYDPLVFTGAVQSADPATGQVVVAVRARNQLGEHVSGTVELVLPGGSDHPGEGR